MAVERGIGTAMEEARAAGAALIAAHPHGAVPDSIPGRTTRRFWRDPELRSLAHRFELINRHRVFAWVAAAGLPAVANGDFHVPEHVDTWKTLLPCARTRPAWSTSCARRRRPPSPASSPRPCPKSSARRPDATTGQTPLLRR